MNNKDTIKKKMNSMGSLGQPFLFVIDFEMEYPEVISLNSVDPAEILFNINGYTNYNENDMEQLQDMLFRKYPVSFKVYLKAFKKVMQNITTGNTYLLNLTFSTPVKINYSLKQILLSAKAKYKLWYKDNFIVFSPETFVKIRDGEIFSYPMKGTINANIENAAELILNDPKETAEHYTIVDLIRNDLNMVAKKIKVERFRYLELIRTNQKDLLQVSSEISGELESDYRQKIGDIIFSLLPAGSVTGAPKKKTVEIIHDTETHKRGYYTGIFGYFDGNNLDSAVMIRYFENENGQLVYKSGGGITSFSDPHSEYMELIDKVYVPFA